MKAVSEDVLRAIAKVSPEYESGMGFLECPYCVMQDSGFGTDTGHTDDCPWLILARAYGEMPEPADV